MKLTNGHIDTLKCIRLYGKIYGNQRIFTDKTVQKADRYINKLLMYEFIICNIYGQYLLTDKGNEYLDNMLKFS